MLVNKKIWLLMSKSYIDINGKLKNFKRFSIDQFKKHIDSYHNCTLIDKSDLEDYEIENMQQMYGHFKDTFLIIIDYLFYFVFI